MNVMDGIRERAREYIDSTWRTERKMDEFLAAFAESEAARIFCEAHKPEDCKTCPCCEAVHQADLAALACKQEREECAKLTCPYCRTADRWSPAEKDGFGVWVHRSTGPVNREVGCRACAIHARNQEEKD